MAKSTNPWRDFFQSVSVPNTQRGTGGARLDVQQASERMLQNPTIPFLAARIYGPPSLQIYDDTDPRYGPKADNVENIYLPSAMPAPGTKAPFDFWHWLKTGKV